jgi:hypothetical protein
MNNNINMNQSLQLMCDEIKRRADRLVCREGILYPPMNYDMSDFTPDEISDIKSESYRGFVAEPLILEALDPQLGRDGKWSDGHLVIIWKEQWVFCTGPWVDTESKLQKVIHRQPNEWLITSQEASELLTLLRKYTPEITTNSLTPLTNTPTNTPH